MICVCWKRLLNVRVSVTPLLNVIEVASPAAEYVNAAGVLRDSPRDRSSSVQDMPHAIDHDK